MVYMGVSPHPIVGGAVMATQQGHGSAIDEAGAGLLIAGVLSKIISAATTPHAGRSTRDKG